MLCEICGKELKGNRSKTCGSKECVSQRLKNTFANRTKEKDLERVNKIKATKKERYGSEGYNNIKKAQSTFEKKYGEGIICNSQTQEWRDSVKETSLKKTNGKYSHHLQDPDVMGKRKETIGAENVFQLEETKRKSLQTIKERYNIEDITNVSQVPEVRKKIDKSLIDYRNSDEYKKLIKEKAIQKIFYSDKFKRVVIPLFTEEECNQIEEEHLWKCVKCGNEFHDTIENGRMPRCLKCYPILSGTSFIEKEITDWINQFIFMKKKRFFFNNKINEIDMYSEDKKFGIELDSLYYHSEIPKFEDQKEGKKKNYHIDKTDYFSKQGINIIHVWDIEWINQQEIVKSIILNKLGLTNENIFARKCEIKEIKERKIVEEFLENNHIQGYVTSSINIGLYYKDELMQLICLSKPRYNEKYQWELTRFCSKKNYSVSGGFSRLLHYFKETYRPESIITYADLRYSTGNLYFKNGFTMINKSAPNYFYTKDYKTIFSRIEFQKHKLKEKLKVFDENLSEWENMQVNGYDRIWDCGNLVFEWKKS